MKHIRFIALLSAAIVLSSHGCTDDSPANGSNRDAGTKSQIDSEEDSGLYIGNDSSDSAANGSNRDAGTKGQIDSEDDSGIDIGADISINVREDVYCQSDSGVSTTDATSALTVTIDVFSGRPNPFFEINCGDAESIRFIIDAINSADIVNDDYQEDAIVSHYLGYIGVDVMNKGKIPGISDRLVVYDDKILLTTGEKRVLLENTESRLEDYFLQLALEEDVVDQDLIDEIHWEVYLRNEGRKYEPREPNDI
jgi:hypothetical protein